MLDEPVSIILVITFMVLMAILYTIVTGAFSSEIADDPSIDSNTKDFIANMNTSGTSAWDNGIMIAFFLMFAGAILASLFVDSHPAFFAIALILLVLPALLAVFISNLFSEMFADAHLAGYVSALPKTEWIIGNFLELILIVGFIVGIVIYGKVREQ